MRREQRVRTGTNGNERERFPNGTFHLPVLCHLKSYFFLEWFDWNLFLFNLPQIFLLEHFYDIYTIPLWSEKKLKLKYFFLRIGQRTKRVAIKSLPIEMQIKVIWETWLILATFFVNTEMSKIFSPFTAVLKIT